MLVVYIRMQGELVSPHGPSFGRCRWLPLKVAGSDGSGPCWSGILGRGKPDRRSNLKGLNKKSDLLNYSYPAVVRAFTLEMEDLVSHSFLMAVIWAYFLQALYCIVFSSADSLADATPFIVSATVNDIFCQWFFSVLLWLLFFPE